MQTTVYKKQSFPKKKSLNQNSKALAQYYNDTLEFGINMRFFTDDQAACFLYDLQHFPYDVVKARYKREEKEKKDYIDKQIKILYGVENTSIDYDILFL